MLDGPLARASERRGCGCAIRGPKVLGLIGTKLAFLPGALGAKFGTTLVLAYTTVLLCSFVSAVRALYVDLVGIDGSIFLILHATRCFGCSWVLGDTTFVYPALVWHVFSGLLDTLVDLVAYHHSSNRYEFTCLIMIVKWLLERVLLWKLHLQFEV